MQGIGALALVITLHHLLRYCGEAANAGPPLSTASFPTGRRRACLRSRHGGLCRNPSFCECLDRFATDKKSMFFVSVFTDSKFANSLSVFTDSETAISISVCTGSDKLSGGGEAIVVTGRSISASRAAIARLRPKQTDGFPWQRLWKDTTRAAREAAEGRPNKSECFAPRTAADNF